MRETCITYGLASQSPCPGWTTSTCRRRASLAAFFCQVGQCTGRSWGVNVQYGSTHWVSLWVGNSFHGAVMRCSTCARWPGLKTSSGGGCGSRWCVTTSPGLAQVVQQRGQRGEQVNGLAAVPIVFILRAQHVAGCVVLVGTAPWSLKLARIAHHPQQFAVVAARESSGRPRRCSCGRFGAAACAGCPARPG
jgi:hypothetical protein